MAASTAIATELEQEIAPPPEVEAADRSYESHWFWKWFTKAAAAQSSTHAMLKDIPYESKSGIVHDRHKLDIYLPKNTREEGGSPVLIHVHGGGWVRGHKNTAFYGTPATCAAFAAYNFLTVGVGYRTSTPFPAAIEDVADAIAWVYNHIQEDQYGKGDIDKVFLSGHSAGAHLASLATLDRKYLDARNVPQNFIKGVIAISGVYSLEDPLNSPTGVYSWAYKKMYIHPTFGQDVEYQKECSPITYIRSVDTTKANEHVPPFLILNASSDLGLDKDGRAFSSVFESKGMKYQYSMLEGQSHASISKSPITMEFAHTFLSNLINEMSPTSDGM